MDHWDKRFLTLAKAVSLFSKDPSSKIGVIAVSDEKQILSMGWNGFPRGIEDTFDRLADRDKKYELVVHGEMNCIYNATHNGVSLKNSTMYVYGKDVCPECAKGLIQVGVKRVVCTPTGINIGVNWSKNNAEKTIPMFEEVGIIYEQDLVP